MKRLEINFAARGRRSPWPGRMLLAVALGLSLDMGLSYRQLSNELEMNQGKIAQAPRNAAARKVPAEEVAAVRETLDRLALPWERLFGALESAASDRVALLGIEPDPKAGTVVISGDSKDYLAALTYVLNLSRSEALDRVQLVRHEVKANDPQAPVSFAVSAGWSEARP
jgi:HAMP domain-containing protein